MFSSRKEEFDMGTSVDSSQGQSSFSYQHHPMTASKLQASQNDRRKKVQLKNKDLDSKSFYSGVGLLTMSFNNKKNRASAFLITENIILTAAHNCYHQKRRVNANNMFFYPSYQSDSTQGPEIGIKTCFYPENYPSNRAFSEDYAVLELNERVPSKYKPLEIRVAPRKFIGQVVGYPESIVVNGQQKEVFDMYTKEGQFELKNNGYDFIKEKVFTSQGQSGSPVIALIQGKYYAVGIHTRGHDAVYSLGLPFNKDNLTVIANQVKKISNASLIRINPQDQDEEHVQKGKKLFESGQYEESLKQFLEYQKKLRSRKNEDPSKILSALYRIGVVYEHINKEQSWKKAIEYYHQCLRIRQQENMGQLQAQALKNIGNIYKFQKNLKQAANYYEKSLRILENNKQSSSKSICPILTLLGLTHEKMQKYDQSLEYYLQIKKMHDKNKGTQRQDLLNEALNLRDIGSVYQKKKQTKEAIKYLELAIKNYQKGLKTQKATKLILEDLSSTIKQLGSIYRPTDPKVALELFKSAFEKQMQIQKDNKSYEVAQTLKLIGRTQYQLKDYESALSTYQYYLPIQQIYKKFESEQVANTYWRIGELYGFVANSLFQKNSEEAIRKLEDCQRFMSKALKIYFKVLPKHDEKLQRKSAVYESKKAQIEDINKNRMTFFGI